MDKITLTGKQLLRLSDLETLAKLRAQNFPFDARYRIQRIDATVGEEMRRMQALRMSLTTPENSETIDGGTRKRIKPEFFAEFNSRLAPLLTEKVSFDIAPLSVAHLKLAIISVDDEEALQPLIEILT